MATPKKKHTYAVWRWYKVAMSKTISADTPEEAAAMLSQMKYDDFDDVEDTEATDEVNIFTT